MEKLRFGICGLGFMGRGHFGRLRHHPQAQIVAVCDQDQARRNGDWSDHVGNLDFEEVEEGRVSLAGIRSYGRPEELIADPDVDAVLIALPTPLHAPVAIAALEAGKHVLTEKPMAYRPGECTRMIDAARQADRTLMVAQCIRFWPQYETIRRYVAEGRIGQVRYASLRRLGSPPTYSAGNWLLDGSQSGGAMLDLHVHDIDFAHVLLGVPDTIHAHGTIGSSGAIDHVVANYGYADGRYALIEGGWSLTRSRPFEMAIIVHGDGGTLDWSMTRGADVLWYTGVDQPESIPCEGDALRNEQDYFIECVRANRPVERCTPESCRVSVTLAWLERRSIELSRTVALSDRLRKAWGVTE